MGALGPVDSDYRTDDEMGSWIHPDWLEAERSFRADG